MPMKEEQATQLDCWAIIDLFGHQKIAGRVRSENFGVACMLRVDVPGVEKRAPERWSDAKRKYVPGGKYKVGCFTRYLGIGSIYGLTPVTEELARKAAEQICAEPVSIFGLESVQRMREALPAGDADGESGE